MLVGDLVGLMCLIEFVVVCDFELINSVVIFVLSFIEVFLGLFAFCLLNLVRVVF